MITVIVPIYNLERYIHTCIKSVLVQSYSDWEMILVDDGSPDNCGRICDEYALLDSRIRVIHKQNEGLSEARNSGIKIAKGDFVTFLDPDDYFEKDCLKTFAENAVENSIVALAANRVCGQQSEILGRPMDSSFSFDLRSKEIHHILNYGQTCGKLYSMEVIKRNNLSK